MSNQETLEQLERQAAQLSLQEQLKLVARISERLSTMPLPMLTVADEKSPRRPTESETDKLLALCDAAAEMWRGEFDVAEEIRQMRQERDEQIWPSKL